MFNVRHQFHKGTFFVCKNDGNKAVTDCDSDMLSFDFLNNPSSDFRRVSLRTPGSTGLLSVKSLGGWAVPSPPREREREREREGEGERERERERERESTHPLHGCDEQVVEGPQRRLALGAGPARQGGGRAAVFSRRHGVAEQAGHTLAAPTHTHTQTQRHRTNKTLFSMQHNIPQ